jgi:hypothetical protein
VQAAIIQTMVDEFSFLKDTSEVTITSVVNNERRLRSLTSSGSVIINYEMFVSGRRPARHPRVSVTRRAPGDVRGQ